MQSACWNAGINGEVDAVIPPFETLNAETLSQNILITTLFKGYWHDHFHNQLRLPIF